MEERKIGYKSLLGVREVINGYETITSHGGSLMPEPVLRAMENAASGFFPVDRVNLRASKRLAELTGNEAAYVTAGCAAGLALAAAACVRRHTRWQSYDLPLTEVADEGLPNVVVERGQRNPYDRALAQCGAQIREYGYPTHTSSADELERAIDTRTVAVFYFAGGIFERYALPIGTAAAVAHGHGIPLIVDGAAQVPPRENLQRYTAEGADLAIFSGGKGLRGPQNSGVILGCKDLVESIRSIGPPAQGFGRTMKTSKEAIAGLLAAVELTFEQDEDAEYRRQWNLAERAVAKLADIMVGETWVEPRGRHGQLYPRVVVRCCRTAAAREDLLRRFADDEPSILLGPYDDDFRAVYINCFSLDEDQIDQIVRRWPVHLSAVDTHSNAKGVQR